MTQHSHRLDHPQISYLLAFSASVAVVVLLVTILVIVLSWVPRTEPVRLLPDVVWNASTTPTPQGQA